MQRTGPRPDRPDPAQRRARRNEEALVYGENAVDAVFRTRPADVVKAYFTEEKAPRFGDAMRMMAAERKAYKIVPAEEIARVAKTAHAGGVAVVVRRRVPATVVEYLRAAERRTRDCVVALEGVGNPHNLGAIVRSAAHFGVRAVLYVGEGTLDSGATARVAEGGAESVDLIRTAGLLRTLGQFHSEGYALATTSSHQGSNLYHTRLPPRLVVVIGGEEDGLSIPVLQASDMVLRIPGTGAVESLNVGVATALVLGEWWRQK